MQPVSLDETSHILLTEFEVHFPLGQGGESIAGRPPLPRIPDCSKRRKSYLFSQPLA